MDFTPLKLLDAAITDKTLAENMSSALKNELKGFEGSTLNIKHQSGGISFYEYNSGKQKSLNCKSPLLYKLARKKYCLNLLDCLDLSSNAKNSESVAATGNLVTLVKDFESRSLDMKRILFSQKQYKWLTSYYKKKRFHNDLKGYTTLCGETMRSKSECKIGTALESYGLPYRYECALHVNVSGLVDALCKRLKDTGELKDPLYRYDGWNCQWNVPSRMMWMNIPGSIWRGYDDRNGTIAIYPDFMILLRNGDVIIWEHEGLCDDFDYRCNASERIAVLRHTGAVRDRNIITTYETDLNGDKELDHIIRTRVLPLVWC